MSRFLLWFSLLVCGLAIIIAVSLQSIWLRDRILTFALDAGTERWSLDAVEGRLLTGITLEGLSLSTAGVQVSFARLEVRPALGRILFGQMALKALLVKDLHVALPATLPAGDPDAPPAEIRLPLPLVLDNFSLSGFRLTRGDEEVLKDLDMAFTLYGRHQTLDIENLSLHWPAQGLAVRGRATVDLAPLHAFGATLDIVREDPAGDLPPLGTRLTAVGSLERIGLTATLSRAVTGTVTADWDLTNNRGRVDGDITAVAIEGLPPELAWHNLAFDAEGSPDALAWEIGFDAGWEALQPRLRARGSLQEHPEGRRLQLDHARLSLDANAVELSGAMTLVAPYDFDAEITGSDLDLSPWLPDFPTRLDLSTRMDGQIGSDPSERRFDLRRLAVDGQWNGSAARLRAAARLSWPDEQLALTVDRFEFDLGDNRIGGRAALADTLDVAIEVALEDIEQLWPTAGGVMRGSIAARGTPSAPRLDLNLTLREIAMGGLRLASGDVAGLLSLDPATPTSLRSDLEGLARGALMLDATAAVQGNWPRLGADVTLDLPDAELAVTATASADVMTLRSADIQSLTIDQRLAGRWQLEQAMQITRSEGETPVVTWTPACLLGDSIGQPSLCLSAGRMDAQGLELDATLTDLAVESFAMLLPDEVQAHGVLQGRAKISGTDLDVSLAVDGGRFRILDPDDQDELFADTFSTLRLNLARRGPDFSAGLRGEAELTGSLGVDGSLQWTAEGPLENAPLAAKVRLDIADITPFAAFLPGISDTGGTLDGEVDVSGRVGDPEFSGNVELVGRAQVQALALALDPVTLRLNAAEGKPAQLRGRFQSNGEALELDAEADWDMRSGLVVSGRLHGDALPLAAMPDLDLTLRPDLNFAMDASSIRLDGKATIPEARARIRSLPQGGGDTLSQDVVIHRPAEEGRQTAPRQRDLHLDLTVILGDSVHLSAAGLETRLTGRLKLQESPGAPLTAQGRLETREGSFKAYGQDLELRTGRLNFDGPLDNPAVEVLAVRRVESAEVGVRVSGFLESLETSLYASPARDEVDTLTMLITGRMPGEASSAELANVSDAALNFGIGRAVPVVGKLVNRLGIDELAVDSPLDEDAGAVVVGTRLTDDIYVRYTYGLHSRLGGLQIEYRVTDWLSIQSETGTTQAIDLIFRREFN